VEQPTKEGKGAFPCKRLFPKESEIKAKLPFSSSQVD